MISFVIVAISSIAKSISLHPFLMEIYGINESVVLVGINSGITFLGEGAILATIFILSFRYKGIDIAVPYKYLFIGGSVCGLLSFVLFLIENKNKFEYKNECHIDSYFLGIIKKLRLFNTCKTSLCFFNIPIISKYKFTINNKSFSYYNLLKEKTLSNKFYIKIIEAIM